MKKISMKSRYYLGSSAISGEHPTSDALMSLEDAMDKATRAVEDGERVIAYVVEVVRVVRRADMPIIIESTK